MTIYAPKVNIYTLNHSSSSTEIINLLKVLLILYKNIVSSFVKSYRLIFAKINYSYSINYSE
jgi:hypothetical protein